ncbi:MAG: ASKHA domain-containing protein [Negativicutes bacterium]|nr:ASKHA domain-containing protein [Negativicutes bacterium]
MAEVIFVLSDRTTKVVSSDGESLLGAARRAGVTLESPCNGNGTCGKCKVAVTVSGEERKIALACKTILQGDATVEIIERHDSDNLQIKQDGLTAVVTIDSPVRKDFLQAANITAVYRGGELAAAEQGDTSGALYGLVVDIGTTTLVVSLIDLLTGRELATAGSLNPQSRLAQDVLSRIRYASNQEGLRQLHRLFIDEVNRLTGEVTKKAAISPSGIYELVFSGNTCMLHLGANISPVSLGKFPYTPLIRGGNSLAAADLGLNAAASAMVYLPPVISAYVGADITSGVLAARLAQRQEVNLFIDIGTNGEIVLAADGLLVATSTAAGPAFEGMNISCGMRAAPGAVEQFRLSPAGQRDIKTIGDLPASGICGSGLLDIVAELVKYGLVTGSGKFSKKLPPQFARLLASVNGKPAFTVTDDITLSQQDIRQVQLAKGAIRAGIEALLQHHGLTAGDVMRVLIAGSFGYHLRAESLIDLGLLPPAFAGRIEFLGNTSLSGGREFLLNNQARQHIGATVAAVTVLELATLANFDRLFVKCLEFPEPDLPQDLAAPAI